MTQRSPSLIPKFTAGLLCSLILTCISQSSISSKPMAEPSPAASEGGAAACNWIVIAEYDSYQRAPLPTYFGGAQATYKVKSILKTNQPPALKAGQAIVVRYDFQDGSACLEEENWKFSEKLMPAKGSKWILFLEQLRSSPPNFLTYRGDYGRRQATQQNVDAVRMLLVK